MIAIVDCGIGNVGSVANMFRKLGIRATITADPDAIAGAEKLVLPGVGAFDTAMYRLRTSRLLPKLEHRVVHDKVPILGICLGLQLMTTGSEEGVEPGLGWLAASTVRFNFADGPGAPKVPHMGWNTVCAASHASWPSLAGEPRFYFAHSYHVTSDDPRLVQATTRHGYDFPVVLRRGHIAGVQFHPEKSHRFGMALLRDFAMEN